MADLHYAYSKTDLTQTGWCELSQLFLQILIYTSEVL